MGFHQSIKTVLRSSVILAISLAVLSFPVLASEVAVENEKLPEEERIIVNVEKRATHILTSKDNKSPRKYPFTNVGDGVEPGQATVEGQKLFLFHCSFVFYE